MNDDSLASDLSITVVRMARNLRLRDATAAVTASQFSAMTVLHRDGPITAGELAARERVSAPSMTRLIEALVNAGMITRTPHPTDRRMAIVELTGAGTDTMTTATTAREQWLRDRFTQLSADQRATLRAGTGIIESILAASDAPS